MTFLKKLGQIILKVGEVAAELAGAGPLVTQFLGSGSKVGATVTTVVSDLSQIGQLVTTIEAAFAAIPNSTGAQKLQAAIPLVASVIKTSEIVSGKKIANDALFTQAVQEYVQATVDLLNSIDQSALKG